MIIKSFGEGLFQLIYMLKISKKIAKNFLSKVPYIFCFLGIFGIPFLLYNEIKFDSYKVFWGGVFEVAQFYTVFFFSTFLITLYEIKKSKKFTLKVFIFSTLSIIFLLIVIFSHRRSYILAIIVILLVVLLSLWKNKFISSKSFFSALFITFIGTFSVYTYMSVKDIRFKVLNDVLLGKRKLNSQTMNIISSTRYNLMLDGIKIITEDFKESRFLNLLIGHGIRSGLYLPHERSPRSKERYESVIFISELIERGILGLMSIMFIYLFAFKKFLSIKLSNVEEVVYLIAFIPLLIHLIASIFTFFWDALLPLYLVMFKVGEEVFKKN